MQKSKCCYGSWYGSTYSRNKQYKSKAPLLRNQRSVLILTLNKHCYVEFHYTQTYGKYIGQYIRDMLNSILKENVCPFVQTELYITDIKNPLITCVALYLITPQAICLHVLQYSISECNSKSSVNYENILRYIYRNNFLPSCIYLPLTLHFTSDHYFADCIWEMRTRTALLYLENANMNLVISTYAYI